MLSLCLLYLSLCGPAADSTLAEPAQVIQDSDSVHRREGFFKRLYRYFDQSNVDRTTQKRFDISFALGPNYSTNTKFGLGILAAGLYRLDRTDSLLSPSDISFFGNISTTGYYQIGVEGNTFFPGRRHRLGYEVSFYSQPTDFWGIGYTAGNNGTRHSYTLKQYRVRADYKYNLGSNCFISGSISFFNFTAGSSIEQWLPAGQRRGYTYTGLAAAFEYDSRDFIPNPYLGTYIRIQAQIFPKGLSSAETFYRIGFSADYYHRLWQGAILACDLVSEFNTGKNVPWVMLSELGGSRRMRGYYKGRYRDRNSIVLQAELRQKIYRRHGIAMWVAAGNVFPNFKRFNTAHTLPEIGIGYRFEFKNRVNIRLDVGVGRNGTGINFNVNEAF